MKNNKLLTIILVVSIALAFSGCAQKPTAKEVLERMQQKYDSIESYKAEIHQIEIEDGKTKETDSIVYFKKPDKFRSDYPPRKVVTVFTSKLIWVYNESKNEVKLRKINASLNETFDLVGFFIKELKKYDVTLAGEEKIDGKDCYVLDLKLAKPNEEPAQIQKLWVSRDWFPAKIQMMIKQPEDFKKVFRTSLCQKRRSAFSNSEGSNLIKLEMSCSPFQRVPRLLKWTQTPNLCRLKT